MADGTLPTAIGDATDRFDARLKVTGAARYGSDFDGGARPAFAYLATSAIALGRITSLDESATRALPGVLEVLTYKNVGERIKPGKTFDKKGYMGSTIAPLASDRIAYAGQIVAVVLADSFETAREGAQKLKIVYAEERPSASFDSPGVQVRPGFEPGGEGEDPKVGDFDSAFATAPVKVDQRYSTPTQHHNAIELFTTSAAWANGKLTVWESSQNVWGFKYGLAEQLGIDAADVHIISPYIGGAFGVRGSLTQRTALICHAAKLLNRPVKLETTREQGFTIATYRAETQHHVKLGADRNGKLVALSHEGWEVSSRPDQYKVAGTDASTRMYACPNVSSKVNIVNADRNTPGFMRAPAETPYHFALECAMDELAYALKMDPIELRRINDTQVEPIKGLHYTSRHVMECFDAASAAFGWSKRDPHPGSMREGDWLIGLGCASTLYPTQMAPASVRVRLTPQGQVRVQTATHEIGQGVYTVIAIVASDRLGIPIDKIAVEVGDSELPPAPVAGGSNSTASVCNVVAMACEDIRDKLARAAVASPDSPFHGADPKTLKLTNGQLVGDNRAEPLDKAIGRAASGAIEAYAENIPHGAPPNGMKLAYSGVPSLVGGAKMKDRIQFAFGAQFVEVRINARTREIRVPRMVGAYAAGRIVNPKTAQSQLMGGQIWGLSCALHEGTEIDRRYAKYYNTDLAEYLVPVNADILQHQVIMLPETDHLINDLGIKGIGELGNVGMNAAVANAVYHATGVRVRDLPIRLDDLLDTPSRHA
jgi:xanthine dehydrogenase YagR molybdenum-binding subunit